METRQGQKETVIRPAAYADPYLRSDGHHYLYAQLHGGTIRFHCAFAPAVSYPGIRAFQCRSHAQQARQLPDDLRSRAEKGEPDSASQ